MATLESAYGASNQTITCTFASLASAAFRQSTAIDNTTNLFLDALVFIQATTHASSAPTGDKAVRVWAYGTSDGGTTYTDGASGTDGAITPTSPSNLRFVGSVNAPVVNTTYKGGPFSIAAAFGGALPQKWGIVIENATGVALGAGTNSAIFQGVEGQSV